MLRVREDGLPHHGAPRRGARGSTRKGMAMRAIHAALFEMGLLAILMPLIAWWLAVSLLQAFVMDLGFSAFYMAYAFVFNLAYDRLFPLPEWQRATPWEQ